MKSLIGVLIILSTQVSASMIDLGLLEDALGNGEIIKDGIVIESEMCAIRNMISPRGSQSIELDYLGETEVFPADFDMTNRELQSRQQENNVVYIKELTEAGRHIWGAIFSKHLCPTGRSAQSARIELNHFPNGIGIRWVADCSDGAEHDLELRCLVD